MPWASLQMIVFWTAQIIPHIADLCILVVQFALQCGTHEIALARVPGSAVWHVMDAAWGSGTPHKPMAVRAWLEADFSGHHLHLLARCRPSVGGAGQLERAPAQLP